MPVPAVGSEHAGRDASVRRGCGYRLARRAAEPQSRYVWIAKAAVVVGLGELKIRSRRWKQGEIAYAVEVGVATRDRVCHRDRVADSRNRVVRTPPGGGDLRPAQQSFCSCAGQSRHGSRGPSQAHDPVQRRLARLRRCTAPWLTSGSRLPHSASRSCARPRVLAQGSAIGHARGVRSRWAILHRGGHAVAPSRWSVRQCRVAIVRSRRSRTRSGRRHHRRRLPARSCTTGF